MRYLTDDDLRKLTPAESVSLPTPVPTQVVSNGEFTPPPQTPDQRRVEAGIERYAEQLGPRHGLTRRHLRVHTFTFSIFSSMIMRTT